MNDIIPHPNTKVLSKNCLPLKAYVVWNVDKKCWYTPRSPTCVLLPGVWADPDDIISEIKLPNYRIVDIDFASQLPADIIRVLALDGSLNDTRNLAIIKLRQLINIHIFQNQELKQQLRKEPHALGTGIQTSNYSSDNLDTSRTSLDTAIKKS